jgi:hypothetical protein
LVALLPALHQQMPVVLPADSPVQIDRVLTLAEAFQLRLILAGGLEASKSAALLHEKKVPVILSVHFPERQREADGEDQEEIESLRRRIEAPGNAAALARAGVAFAFQSDDMASPRDFMNNVIRAVEAGLDRQTALRALTLTPAEIFGVADRLGSIEKGKAANLIVATGDLFDPRTRVKQVFIDGHKFDNTETESPPATNRVPGRPTNDNDGDNPEELR